MSRVIAVIALVVVTAAFLFVALRAEGNHATQVELNDAGIWLSRTSTQEIGRLNADLRLTDATLNVATQDFELLQSGGTVFVRTGDHLRSIDVRIPQSRGETALPPGSVLGVGGAMAAVLDPAGGRLWMGDGVTIGTTDYVETEPDILVPDADGLVVGVDGAVHLVDRDAGTVYQVSLGSEPTPEMDVGRVGDAASLTVVGEIPVVLDGTDLHFDETTVSLAAYEGPLLLQEPGPARGGVIVASNAQLLSIDFETGFVTPISEAGTGQPATPVVIGGCAYGAWAEDPVTVQACDNSEAISRDWPQIADGSQMRFRVNRNRVVLNTLLDGGAILFTEGDAVHVNDWSQALSDQEDEEDTATEPVDESETRDRQCDRDGNKPPVAAADEVVTRQGRPIVIRPLANDTDVNCDVLTIEMGELEEGIGEVAMIEGNRALQYSPPADRTEKVVIPYTVSDGLATDTSTITIEFEVIDGANEPPIPQDDETFVTQGRTITHNVLLNDHDPDGDALALLSVGEPNRGGDVRYRPDGQVVYTAPGDLTGAVEIIYVVVDEAGATAEGTLTVRVGVAGSSNPPVARSDHAVGFVDEAITVNVLANDSDAEGDPLILSSVTPAQGTTLDIDAGTVMFSTNEPGSYRFTYTVADGRSGKTAEGSLRIDVYERGGVQPPVAVRDDVVAIPGVPTVVDVLANDYEPDGDVLVVRSVTDVPDDLTVEIVDRSLLRITADTADTSSTLEFQYRVSDGVSESVGLVVVRPMFVGGDNQAPVLTADSAQAHAGGIVSIPVLDNDYDPEGDILILEGATVREPQGKGVFIVDGEALRFLAPLDFEGTVTGTYTVFDGFNRASETIRVRVKPATAEDNLAPAPPVVTARTFVGQRVRIPLPMTSMDPDGDPVEILGMGTERESQPRLGQVIEVTFDEIVYLPFNMSTSVGTDRFTYRVRDSFGAEGTGVVEVGIVPFPDVNGSPVAIDDEYTVPIGGRVVLQPLLNDSDPEGAPLRLVDEDLVPPARGAVRIVADGTAIEFSAPASEDVVIFGYSIVDPGGARDSATIEVTVSDAAENLPPVAVDDILEPQDAGAIVTVPVLENDRDPDGDVLALTVEVLGFPDTTVNTDGSITFTMPAAGAAFAYSITDPDDLALTSTAFVQVPALINRPPKVPFASVDADYNETVTMDLISQATDPDGDSLTIVPDSFIVAHGSGSVTMAGDAVIFDPDDRFSGESGFTYAVTDGDLTTVGSVRVIVAASGNETPSFTTLDLKVPAGGSRVYDMEENVVDPDDEGHAFLDLDTSELPSSIHATLSGDGELRVEATDLESRGLGGRISFTIDDGKEDGVAVALVNITVVGSDKPKPVAKPDSGEGFDDLRQGEPAELDVLRNDFDPFQDGSLTITTYGPVSPANAGAFHQGSPEGMIGFTPSDDFHGTATIPYAIIDRTNDPDRTSSTTVTINIKGRPDAPDTPTGTAESRQATLQWAIPSANGAPISSYEVRDQSGTIRCTSVTNSCTATNLTNGESYRFVVRAINEVGSSPDSDPSNALIPNQRPDAPPAPATQFGDGEMTVTWTAPNNEGSVITGYTIRITPGGQTREEGANSRTLVWPGLTNGTPYSFEVQAKNGPPDDELFSDWSQNSAFDVPAGIPLNQAAPNPPQGGDRIVAVTWDEPNINGAAIQAYEVTVYRDGSATSTVPIADPGNRSYTLTGAANGSEYQFAVRSQNKAGWSDISSRSAVAVPSGKPFGISGLSASIGNASVTLSYPAPDDNGAPISRYQVAVGTSSDPRTFSDFGGSTVTGLSNGTDYWFRVRACNINGCSDELSNVASGNPCTAPATPVFGTPSVSSRTITWNWSILSDGGRSPITYTLSDVVNRTQSSTSYSNTFPSYSTTYTLGVRASNSCPVSSQSDTATKPATTGPPPPPPTYTIQLPSVGTCPETEFVLPTSLNGGVCDWGFKTGTREVLYRRQQVWACDGTTDYWWYRDANSSFWYARCGVTEIDPVPSG